MNKTVQSYRSLIASIKDDLDEILKVHKDHTLSAIDKNHKTAALTTKLRMRL